MDKEQRQRMERLSSMIIDGQEAEIVKKYADKWLEEVKSEVLSRLLEECSDPVTLKYQYRACVNFHRYVAHTAQVGQMKQEKLNEMSKKER